MALEKEALLRGFIFPEIPPNPISCQNSTTPKPKIQTKKHPKALNPKP